MSLFNRLNTILQAKGSRVLDKAEDPGETLDYSYSKQLELLQNVKRSLADLVTAKRRLQLEHDRVQADLDRLDGQARQAVAANREDLARTALQRKVAAQGQIESLDQQLAQLAGQQEKLTDAERRLEAKIEAFRATKETLKAQYSASEAQVRISEAASGISEEMADVGLALERAQDRTEQMQARAAALDELTSTGALEDLSGGDDIDRQLSEIGGHDEVERQLTALKAQLPQGQKQLGADQ